MDHQEFLHPHLFQNFYDLSHPRFSKLLTIPDLLIIEAFLHSEPFQNNCILVYHLKKLYSGSFNCFFFFFLLYHSNILDLDHPRMFKLLTI